MARPGAAETGVALSIHGPRGVLDLVVPAGASAADVAREYAAQSGLGSVPLIHTALGRLLPPDTALAEARVGAGDVLVATTTVHRPQDGALPAGSVGSAASPGPLAAVWFTISAAIAVLAGWLAARDPGSALAATTVLLLGAVIGVLPFGRYAVRRALAAPAFTAAAAYVVVWDPHPDRLPLVVGISALAGAVTAAVARALHDAVDEGLRVWMVTGGLLFVVSGAAALLGLGPVPVWGLLLVLAVLAARFVPALSVDVPDQLLIDLERLAVTAWSARELPAGRRGRVVASPTAVATVAAGASRLMAAAGVAIAAVAVLCAAALLAAEVPDVDRIGALAQVFLAGGALLLAGRSYRQGAPRAALRVAGLGCWAVLLGALLTGWPAERVAALGGVATGLAFLVVVVAVAAGRGWRSAWWSRRAEVAEVLCGAGAVAALIVTAGIFRTVWELASVVAR